MILLLNQSHSLSAFNLIQQAIHTMHQNGIDQWDEIYPIQETLENDIINQQAFGYFSKQELIGFIAINNEAPQEYQSVLWESGGNSLIIHRLTIQPLFQGKGIAKKMMLFAEKTAYKKGYHAIRLDAFENNPAANSLYLKLGYKKIGTVQFRKGTFNCYEKIIHQNGDPQK